MSEELKKAKEKLWFWKTYGRDEYPKSQQAMVEAEIKKLTEEIAQLEAEATHWASQ